mmetsp:Transcript_10984/g.34310  ORF Transcript_10984/g.34310 Transcript_10984/m.34310 type:complete len:272 (+) Transcript_10984:223-1038(+)
MGQRKQGRPARQHPSSSRLRFVARYHGLSISQPSCIACWLTVGTRSIRGAQRSWSRCFYPGRPRETPRSCMSARTSRPAAGQMPGDSAPLGSQCPCSPRRRGSGGGTPCWAAGSTRSFRSWASQWTMMETSRGSPRQPRGRRASRRASPCAAPPASPRRWVSPRGRPALQSTQAAPPGTRTATAPAPLPARRGAAGGTMATTAARVAALSRPRGTLRPTRSSTSTTQRTALGCCRAFPSASARDCQPHPGAAATRRRVRSSITAAPTLARR